MEDVPRWLADYASWLRQPANLKLFEDEDDG